VEAGRLIHLVLNEAKLPGVKTSRYLVTVSPMYGWFK
jgi:hypothetical protein